MNRAQYRKIVESLDDNASKDTQEEGTKVLKNVLNEKKPSRVEYTRKRLRYDPEEGCLYRVSLVRWQLFRCLSCFR
jgi:hypothetical protein